MKFLATADIHLDDNPRNEYRWGIFEWLRRRAETYRVDFGVICGDLTDRKDYHSSALANRIHDELEALNDVCPWYVLKGNHDYDQDPDTPFFRWWKNFITHPEELVVGGDHVYLFPNTRKSLAGFDFTGFDVIFMHQCFIGSQASNGFLLETGSKPALLSKSRTNDALVISGDIHVPQKVGNVIYCGSPHPVRFGDEYPCSVLYFDGEKLKRLKRRTIRKATPSLVLEDGDVSEIEEDLTGLYDDFTAGDQLKFTVYLPRFAFPDWAVVREAVTRWAEKRGVHLESLQLKELEGEKRKKPTEREEKDFGSSAKDLFDSFCEAKDVPRRYRKTGEKLL